MATPAKPQGKHSQNAIDIYKGNENAYIYLFICLQKHLCYYYYFENQASRRKSPNMIKERKKMGENLNGKHKFTNDNGGQRY